LQGCEIHNFELIIAIMTSSNDKPLVTFTICAYNQEQFIREAVDGAFAQTYSPLEIILSDDCSKDRTFEIMREMAESYRGQHQVILNRNPINLGLGGHCNRLVELAHGELLVGAAGDDICFPNRVELIHQAWEHSGRRAMGIQSGWIDIDEKGNIIGNSVNQPQLESIAFREEKPAPEDYVRTLQPEIIGAAFSVHPLIYRVFGPLPSTLIHEDNVTALRAICLGSLMFVKTPLIKRRFHGNNIFSRHHEMVTTWDTVKQQEDRFIRDAKSKGGMYDAFLADMQLAKEKNLISEDQWIRLKQTAVHHRRLLDYQVQYGTANTARKLQILYSLRRAHGNDALVKWMLLRLIPTPLFRSMKVVGNSMRLALGNIFRTLTPGSQTR
jgi:glycosyltransferase involved in cell wall biosynthesis